MDLLPKPIQKLCVPAFAYLVLSTISFLSLLAQNLRDSKRFCMGRLSCQVPHVSLVLLGKVLYIAFWTWAINSLCKSGYKRLAWTLLFLPVILFFILATLLITLIAVDEKSFVELQKLEQEQDQQLFL